MKNTPLLSRKVAVSHHRTIRSFSWLSLLCFGLWMSLSAQAQTQTQKSSKAKSASSTSTQTPTKSVTKTPTKVVGSTTQAGKPKLPEAASKTEGPDRTPAEAAVSTLEPESLENFATYTPQIQQLVRSALALTRQNLRYTFGSSDPKNGGMDCSGAIYHLLTTHGIKGVPRQSDEMCGWVQERTLLHRWQSADSVSHPEFADLRPGDLLFWSGTYASAPRKIPVTHVMLYLGRLKKSGKPVVFGASDGRSYQGARRSGVSVFDFSLPKAGGTSQFYGYGLIPTIGKIQVTPPPPPPIVVAKSETPPALMPSVSIKPTTALIMPQPTRVTKSTVPLESPPEVMAVPKEEVRKATPAPPEALAETPPAPKKPTSTVAKVSAPPTKTTAKAKTSSSSASASSKPKAQPASTPVRRRRPPPPPTTQQKIEKAAQKAVNSVRNVFTR